MKAFSKLASWLAPSDRQPHVPPPLLTASPQLHAAADGKIQILSDLHLEVCKQYATFAVPATGAPYLILAGDIGRLIDYDLLLGFLAGLVASYRRVFYVLGNHEFYGICYAAGIDEARRLESEPSLEGKLTLLHRTRWDEGSTTREGEDGAHGPRLTILGCTLWSQIAPQFRDVVAASINDFRHIHDWSVDAHDQAHMEDLAWLREQVAAVRSEAGTGAARPRATVIVTHHAPTVEGTSSPEYAANPWSSAFATELIVPPSPAAGSRADADEPTSPWDGVAAWIYGHTHYCTDFVREGIRVVANQRGYAMPPGEQAPERRAHQAQKAEKDVEKRGGQKKAKKAADAAGDEEAKRHKFDARKTISY